MPIILCGAEGRDGLMERPRVVGMILAEARSCTDSHGWASKRRRLMLTFHPDKLAVAASIAEELVKSMQNHVLWN